MDIVSVGLSQSKGNKLNPWLDALSRWKKIREISQFVAAVSDRRNVGQSRSETAAADHAAAVSAANSMVPLNFGVSGSSPKFSA